MSANYKTRNSKVATVISLPGTGLRNLFVTKPAQNVLFGTRKSTAREIFARQWDEIIKWE